jgi:signal transduction histidine kinase
LVEHPCRGRLQDVSFDDLRAILDARSRDELLDELRANNAALTEATRRATEATRSKSEFMANISHEIRTPMNAIIGLSHLAMRGELSPRHRDYLSKIHTAGSNLLGIVNDVLDFSKIEAGKLEMDVLTFALPDVIDEITALVGHRVGEKSLELLCRMDADVPLVVPEINGADVKSSRGIIANPNCTTAIAAVVLWPLHQHFGQPPQHCKSSGA